MIHYCTYDIKNVHEIIDASISRTSRLTAAAALIGRHACTPVRTQLPPMSSMSSMSNMTQAQEYAEWLRTSQYESDGFGLKTYMVRDGHNPLRLAVRGLSYGRVLLCDPKTLDDILQWVKQNLSARASAAATVRALLKGLVTSAKVRRRSSSSTRARAPSFHLPTAPCARRCRTSCPRCY
eukprot:COSAG06_NODE_965_length_11299_cov_14.725536_9_plen_180_part_00